MMIEVVTDNRNRAVNDLKSLLTKNSGIFADAGSVAYMFQRRGEIRLEKRDITEDQITEAALDAGAEDVVDEGEEWIVYTAIDQLFAVNAVLKEKGINSASQKLIYQPGNLIPITDPEIARQVIKLYDALEEYDDTQNVYTNFDLSDEVAAGLE